MSLLLEAISIEKSFADRRILNVKSFKVYSGDRIGFVGANGCGKTTFLNILAGFAAPDSGRVTKLCDISYIQQFGEPESAALHEIDQHKLSEYKVKDKLGAESVSGGENTRLRIAGALSGNSRLLFADEPTSNLDAEGIRTFCQFLSGSDSFIIISHDRDILNNYCNKIMTIKDCDIVIYNGGFKEYSEQIRMEKERAQTEYEQYASEKERLTRVYEGKRKKAHKMVKAPKNMSASERKMREFTAAKSFQAKQKSMDTAAKSILLRIEHMEVKEKPREIPKIKIDFGLTDPPANKTVISGNNISFAYGSRVIFDKASFAVKNGAKIAVCGENGSGKTTLFNIIHSGHPSVYKVPKAKIGYFYQGFQNIDFNSTVLQNTMENSVQSESISRGILARLLFKRDDVYKQAGVLSGGERIKLSLAKLLVSDINILLLDEPTNYLDMPSIEVLQSILQDYEGTILFVSHDKSFVNSLCTELLLIKNKTVSSFEGNLDSLGKPEKRGSNSKILLENKLADLSGRIVLASEQEKMALEEEYQAVYNLLRNEK